MHVYQLLDVVVFAPLKREYGRLRDEHLRQTGEAITKENFLKVYGQAHLNMLTPELIKTGFRKVGIIPFDRNVVTPEMMAPSKDTSYKVISPVLPSTPVRIVSDLLMDVIQPHKNPERPRNAPLFPIQIAVPQLAGTDVGYLVSESPIQAAFPPPDMPNVNISPVKPQTRKRPAQETPEPPTLREIELEEKLLAWQAKTMKAKGEAMQLQATVVLMRIYCAHLRAQQEAREKKQSKKDIGGKLDADLPPLLTADEYVEQVRLKEAATRAAHERQNMKKDRREAFNQEKREWEIADGVRRARNAEREVEWKKAEGDWLRERAVVKANGGKLKVWESTHPKPKKSDPQWKPEGAIPKPKLLQKVPEAASDSSGEDFDLDIDSEDDEEE